MHWDVIDTGKKSALANMQEDAKLLANVKQQARPLLHLYEFCERGVTYGHFVRPEKDLKKESLTSLSLARRPTGGGIIFHRYDFPFSILIPAHMTPENTLESYRVMNQITAKVINSAFGVKVDLLQEVSPGRVTFCMVKPTQYDLTFQGKKVGGAAQRRTRDGILHQGSLSLVLPDQQFLSEHLINRSVVHQMIETSFALVAPNQIAQAREKLKETWVKMAKFDTMPSF
jgi:lipoate-protein ligase A